MDASAVEGALAVLRPLAGRVHVVLVGKGSDLIRCTPSGDPAVTLTAESIRKDVHQQSAQLGALALTLAKQGIPHVSVLDGGYGSVLRCFWNCENAEEEGREGSGGDAGLNLSFDPAS
jgi:hypothetical protein